RFLGKILLFFAKTSLYDPKPLLEKLRAYASPERIAHSGRELRIGAVSLETGDFVEVDQTQPDILTWTLGSSSMPLFFPPVPVGSQHLVEGGVRSATPLRGAFSALKRLNPQGQAGGTDEMYVILASPLGTQPANKPWKSGLDVGQRAAGI